MNTKTRRQGPHPISEADKRTHCVSVRLNDAELQIVDGKKGKLARGEWFRVAFLDKLPRNKSQKELEFIERTNTLYMRLNKSLGAIGAIAKVDRTLTKEQLINLTELKHSINELQDVMLRRRP